MGRDALHWKLRGRGGPGGGGEAAIAPSGFTRRYGNTIAARIGVVQRDGLDACLK